MGKYFGTDGIRGVVNKELDGLLAYKIGRAAALVLSSHVGHKPVFYIGMDTRLSGVMFEAALSAGLCSMGAEVCELGVLPTPAVAHLTANNHADAGVVISASHNPQQYNGVKIFGATGYKLDDGLEEKVEALIDEEDFSAKYAEPARIGRITKRYDMAGDYCEHVLSTCPGADLSGMKLLFDCANGAASETAASIFTRTGAACDFIHNKPDGLNINRDCGSTALSGLSEAVVRGGYDVGIAFDGDADRCLAVDERGSVINGDRMIGACALDLKARGLLPDDTAVVTVLSNLGLHEFFKKNGMKLSVTGVGDRAVLEEMRRGGYAIGGEQSGHVIFTDAATTGDGQLTALRYLDLLKRSGLRASELTAGISDYPQVMLNVKVDNALKHALSSVDAVREAVARAEEELGETGRILVRPSGTEALVRVMVECREREQADRLARAVAGAIESLKA